MLQSAYLLANVGFDTAENEPAKFYLIWKSISANFAKIRIPLTDPPPWVKRRAMAAFALLREILRGGSVLQSFHIDGKDPSPEVLFLNQSLLRSTFSHLRPWNKKAEKFNISKKGVYSIRYLEKVCISHEYH